MNWIRIVLACCIVFLVLVDQWVKQWAKEYLMPVGSLPFIDGFLGFRYTTNTGAAFGIFPDGRWFFIILTIVVLIVIVVYEFKIPYTKRNMWGRIPLAMITAGAIGNFVDRLFFGYVIDMFEFLFINFPIFNVADILLVTGTVIFAFASIFVFKEEENA